MSTGKTGAPGGRAPTLHIRSQELQSLALTGHRVTSGFSAFPIESVASAPEAPTRKHSWREVDLRRALVAARRAKLRNYRVEVAPDGTISIVVTGTNRTARR